jgi:DMSO reductase iron-sulfur subunit
MTTLPLFESELLYRRQDALVHIGVTPLIPAHAPRPGEQYRFHFDMTKCIGCKCCVVACNEQNGNPAAINWRRVGEIEGGYFPNTQRHYLSMGCNHCVEPSCMIGCPVEAYHKDPVTGVVLHNADTCIGCQYCTWNCSYGVPQYNPERGVVGKCDMCHNRLSDGMAPACVNACPEGAISIAKPPTHRACRRRAIVFPPPGSLRRPALTRAWGASTLSFSNWTIRTGR